MYTLCVELTLNNGGGGLVNGNISRAGLISEMTWDDTSQWIQYNPIGTKTGLHLFSAGLFIFVIDYWADFMEKKYDFLVIGSGLGG